MLSPQPNPTSTDEATTTVSNATAATATERLRRLCPYAAPDVTARVLLAAEMVNWPQIACGGQTPPSPILHSVREDYLRWSCEVLGEHTHPVREFKDSLRAVQELTDLLPEIRRIYDEAHDILRARNAYVEDPHNPYPNVRFYWEQVYDWSFKYDYRGVGYELMLYGEPYVSANQIGSIRAQIAAHVRDMIAVPEDPETQTVSAYDDDPKHYACGL